MISAQGTPECLVASQDNMGNPLAPTTTVFGFHKASQVLSYGGRAVVTMYV